MSTLNEQYDAAVEDLRAAESNYSAAEDRLIRARRAKRDAEIAYYNELFPTREALQAHFMAWWKAS